MRKASTELLEQGIQAPSPAPDLILAEHQPRTYIAIGTSDWGTSMCLHATDREGPITNRAFIFVSSVLGEQFRNRPNVIRFHRRALRARLDARCLTVPQNP
jgi:hypothetical protein